MLADGRLVGYGFKERNGTLRVQFPSPTDPGKYSEVSTGINAPKGFRWGNDPPAEAHVAAAKIIRKAYEPTLAADPTRSTWADAEASLETADLRTRTRATYRDALHHLVRLTPTAKKPADITVELAQQFAQRYRHEKYRRSDDEDAKTYQRSAQTVYNAIANLSIIWSHLEDSGLVNANPWDKVKRPKLPKRVPTIPSEDAISTLFAWLDTRFPNWELVRLFLELKALAGCRLNDLAQVKSDQLKGDTLTITPDQDKTQRERVIPLPPDIAARLHALKGRTYLWEKYTEDAQTYRRGRRNEGTFRPSLMYNAIKWVFRQYQAAHPTQKIKSHDLRKRAITLTAMATQSMDATGEAFNLSPGRHGGTTRTRRGRSTRRS